VKTFTRLRSQHRRASAEARHKQRSRRATIETLEPRQVLAATYSASLSDGILRISGSDASEKIFVRQIDGKISIKNLSGSWYASKVNCISVQLRGGDDYISFNSLANGGNRAIDEYACVRSGAGNERVRLGNSHDVYFSGMGHKLEIFRTGCVKLDGVELEDEDEVEPSGGNAWVNANIQDTGIRNLANQYLNDGTLNRADMLAIFTGVRQDGTVSAVEFNDLQLIVNNSSLFTGFGYVQVLAGNVVLGDAANAHYQGQSLGNLQAGNSGAKLEKLVGKWFLGTDRPLGESDWGPTYAYRQASGSLFVNGASYTDVRQGGLGDCYVLASLAEVALQNASAIYNMFIVNGDGTYTVRFFHGSVAEYVTVDSFLPTNGNGYFVFANMGGYSGSASNELWVALAEKAYVQMNESGWLRPSVYGGGQNVYTAISGGWMYQSLGQITGQSTLAYQSVSGSMTALASAFNAGKSICLGSISDPPNSNVVGNHAYAVLGVNTTNQTVTVFNPWGMNNGQAADVITLSWSQIQNNFDWYDRTA
jgi:hypothetical protein